MNRSPLAVVVAVLLVALFVAPAAYAVTYVFAQKTFLQGWDADGPYDSPAGRWYAVDMSKSNTYYGLVALIRSDGAWTCSLNAQATDIGCSIGGNIDYQKKPYCKNTSSQVYVATCRSYS